MRLRFLYFIKAAQKPKQVTFTATGTKRELLKLSKETAGQVEKQRRQP